MKKAFFKNARGQITGSDEGLHLLDPKGDELYLKFMAHALQQYDEGKKNGKSAPQLLSPDSPDYVGKSIAQFKRPMDQWFRDTISDAPTPPSAKFDPAAVKSLSELQTAYQAGRVSRETAAQIAIDRGWAARRAPAPHVPTSQ